MVNSIAAAQNSDRALFQKLRGNVSQQTGAADQIRPEQRLPRPVGADGNRNQLTRSRGAGGIATPAEVRSQQLERSEQNRARASQAAADGLATRNSGRSEAAEAKRQDGGTARAAQVEAETRGNEVRNREQIAALVKAVQAQTNPNAAKRTVDFLA